YGPSLTTLLFLHHLVGARRQVQYFFGKRFNQLCQEIPDTNQAQYRAVASRYRQCAVAMLLERRQCLGNGLRGGNRPGTFRYKAPGQGLVPVETVPHTFRQDITLGEDPLDVRWF